MKTPEEWMDLYDPAWSDDPGPAEMTLERVRAIQADASQTKCVCCGEEAPTRCEKCTLKFADETVKRELKHKS